MLHVKLIVKSAIQEVQEVPQQGKTTLKTINDYAVGAGTVATAGIVSAVPTVPSAAVAPLAEERLPAVVLK